MRRLVAAVATLALASCVHDVVLPDAQTDAECGNGVLESGEQCDVVSPGCVSCVIAPDWTCTETTCTQLCGDGVTGSGCTQRDTACDMTGYWAARETDYTRDAVVGGIQTSSQWYLYRFQQTGDDFTVADELDCGVHVTGSAAVDYTAGTLRGLLYASRMDGASPRGPRHGTSKAVPGGCAITLDRWYKVRGASESYLPPDFSAKPALSTLAALPSVADPVNGKDVPAGSEDPDNDGIPGCAFRIGGLVAGIRNSAQRDWKEYATPAGQAVPASALTLAIPGAFDLQENILRVTECGGGCALLASAAHPAQDKTPRLTLSFVGRTFGSPRVAAVLAGVPRHSLDADLTTCANVRLVLPHDPSVP